MMIASTKSGALIKAERSGSAIQYESAAVTKVRP
jgi:hypothetical protein